MSAASEESDRRWEAAKLVATLVSIDPMGLGGAIVRSGPGPQRDAWESLVVAPDADNGRVVRLPLGCDHDRLRGGIDFSAALATGELRLRPGLLSRADQGTLIVSAGHQLDEDVADLICRALDDGQIESSAGRHNERVATRFGVIVRDESTDDDERPPSALVDRLAFRLDLSGISYRSAPGAGLDPREIAVARQRLPRVASVSRLDRELCEAALALGIASIRADILALACARAHAALQGRSDVAHEDVVQAVRLVLLPRAMQAPDSAAPEDTAAQSETETNTDAAEPAEPEPGQKEREVGGTTDLVVEAMQYAAVDDDLLAPRAQSARSATAGRSRHRRARTKSDGVSRGRPMGTRHANSGGRDRIDIVATLRAAAPWQRIRAAANGSRSTERASRQRIAVRCEDFRVKRYSNPPQVTVVFAVDASGSTAIGRLAEAKGAVETLLAGSYRRRDQVAVVSFRGEGAEVLLPPTRALARAKRSLAQLPGGGATPLAAGIEQAHRVACDVARGGRTPVIVLITDGRPNIDLTGTADRQLARSDALRLARVAGKACWSTLLLDAAKRRGDQFTMELAEALGADYHHLPLLTSRTVAGAVESTLQETIRGV